MPSIPDITLDCEDIVVDEIRVYKPFFRPLTWSVFWRSVHNADNRGRTVLTRDVRSGMGALGQRRFRFTINWRQDLRRRLLFDDENVAERMSVAERKNDVVSGPVSLAKTSAASFSDLRSGSSRKATV